MPELLNYRKFIHKEIQAIRKYEEVFNWNFPSSSLNMLKGRTANFVLGTANVS